MSKITIYHGSEKIINYPDIKVGKKHNDYGQGFYCTEDLELAKEWACKNDQDGFANVYELDLNDLRVLRLNSNGYTILNWIAILLKNRVFSLDTPLSRSAREYIIEHFGINVEEYDVIIAHSFTGALIAYEVRKRYGIPYYVTWHGSDIHTHPVRNKLIRKDTRMVMEAATCNFFVSKALMLKSDELTLNAAKKVLYNGISESFERFPDDKRRGLRVQYGLSLDDKVVAFVGSIVAVKNVHVLQPLFHAIRAGFDGKLRFWMVGDGKLRGSVEPALMSDETIDVKLWGNVPADEMPDVMNCIDVMVLPSLNEGLPLVFAEAVNCGANVVGADVGGIPEVIGREYVVPHGEEFIEAMAAKVIELLKTRPVQHIPDDLDWKRTAELEIGYMS